MTDQLEMSLLRHNAADLTNEWVARARPSSGSAARSLVDRRGCMNDRLQFGRPFLRSIALVHVAAEKFRL